MIDFVKSPLNYTGGKFKLLPQIYPLIPKNTANFVDLFGGGANVLVNIDAYSYSYNDFDSHVASIISWIKNTPTEEALDNIDLRIKVYELSKTNKDGYLKLREDYNANPSAATLYTLICYAFNNQIRFNSRGEYNMPFGKDRSSFNPALRRKFIEFSKRLQSLPQAKFYSLDYRDVPLEQDSFVYCDPPYLLTTATYNERDGWTEYNERELLSYLDDLDAAGIRFALSNVTHHGGKTNDLLLDFAKSHNTHELSVTYSNASYQKKDKTSISREVLITNY